MSHILPTPVIDCAFKEGCLTSQGHPGIPRSIVIWRRKEQVGSGLESELLHVNRQAIKTLEMIVF